MSQGCCVPVLQPIWAFMDLILLKLAPVSLKLKHFFKIYIHKNWYPFMTILYTTGMKYREIIYAPQSLAQFCQTLRTLRYFD